MLSLLLLGAGCIENTLGKGPPGEGGGPAILVEPETIDFGSLDPADSASAVFRVTSVGTVALEISEIALASAAFAVVSTDTVKTLEPDAFMDVVVSYHPINPTDAAWVSIRSNDLARPEARVNLSGGALLPGLTLDPPALDFGGVEMGGAATRPVALINSGEAPLVITSVIATGDRFSSVFLDSLPLELAPGEQSSVDITFGPEGAGLYTGTLWVASNVASGITSAPLAGQAGLPIAVCSVTPDLVYANDEAATYVGSSSYDPEGGTIVAWEWTLLSSPAGSRAGLAATSGPTVGIAPDLAGLYEAALVVQNELGLRSDPCIATLEAVPGQDLWIELYWGHSGDDMDLHLLSPGGSLTSSEDCYYGNCVGGGLDWGARGDDVDNPHLDLDDIPGTGPENINISSPEDGVFTVYVHDYPGSVYQGSNDATVRIYLGGVLAWEETRTITGENDYVPYAEIDWPDGGVNPL